jgi:predicted DNA-binding transcriptional regulator YafY
MNRVDRLLALILFLQSKRLTTAEEMARHFELSVRTIYRDLSALGEAGVPIAAEAGVGYTLMKGYPVNFTAEEASALVTGGMLVEQFTDASLKAQMHSALLKQWFGQKSGGNSTVRPEFIITGLIFYPRRVES